MISPLRTSRFFQPFLFCRDDLCHLPEFFEVDKSELNADKLILHALEFDGNIAVVAGGFQGVKAGSDRHVAVTQHGALEVVIALFEKVKAS